MRDRIQQAFSLLPDIGKMFRRSLEDAALLTEEKTANDFVTAADREIEAFLDAEILSAFPEDAILQEEKADVEGKSGYRWVIDPIDGTNNYARKIPDARVQIALMEGERIVLGIIYNPLTEEAYCAEDGKGASVIHLPSGSSRVLRVAKRPLEKSMVLYTAAIAKGAEVSSRLFAALLGNIGAMRIYGAASVSFELIASGRADAFLCDVSKPMDMAAGALIVREAGGVAVDYAGADWTLHKPDILVGTPANRAALLAIITAAGAVPRL
jgi:myo-inositol-1(or 4)-monophosphatase